MINIQRYAKPWVLFGLLIVIFLLVDSCNRKKRDREISELKKEVQYWKDESGNAHAKLQESLLTQEDMREKVDSIAKVLNIKPKQVTRYVKVGLGVDTTVTAKVTPKVDPKKNDTIPCPEGGSVVVEKPTYLLEYSDSTFLRIKATVPSDPQQIEVGLNANLTFTNYYKRKKVLGIIPVGKKVEYIDIGTDNPYIKITNAEAARIIPKPKLKVRAGIGFGLTYDPWSKTINPGIQMGLYLIRSK